MTNPHLRWEEPPRPRTRTVYRDTVAALRERPGEWAVITAVPYADAKTVYNLSHRIRHGVVAAFRPVGHFEAVVRRVGDQARCYVRYVGSPS